MQVNTTEHPLAGGRPKTSTPSLPSQPSVDELKAVVLFAGTYRCDVQDASFRRVKRVYWGIRVLPVGVLDLDYESSLVRWNSTTGQQRRAVSDRRTTLLYVVHFRITTIMFMTAFY